MSANNQIFRNNETGAEVYILDNKGNFYILSNGMQITQEAFISKYTPVSVPLSVMQTESNDTKTNKIDPANILQELAEIKKGQNKIMENNSNQTQGDVVDPTAFLYSSNPSYNNLVNKVATIDPSRVPEIPASQDLTTVKIYNPDGSTDTPTESLEEKKAALIREHNRTAVMQGKPMIAENRLNGDALKEYKQIDENDEKALDKFLVKKDARTGEMIDQTTGLSELQTRKRKVAIETTGEDPFKERVEQWQKTHNIAINAPVKSNGPVVEQYNNSIPSNVSDSINTNTNANTNSSMDVMDMILSSFEENHPIIIKLNIIKKIIDPAFFKIISKNLKGDAVEHYTNQILNDLLSDVQGLHDEIYKQVKAVLKVNKTKSEITSVKVVKSVTKQEKIAKAANETEKNIDSAKKETVVVKEVVAEKTEDLFIDVETSAVTETTGTPKVKRGPKPGSKKQKANVNDQDSQSIS